MSVYRYLWCIYVIISKYQGSKNINVNRLNIYVKDIDMFKKKTWSKNHISSKCPEIFINNSTFILFKLRMNETVFLIKRLFEQKYTIVKWYVLLEWLAPINVLLCTGVAGRKTSTVH